MSGANLMNPFRHILGYAVQSFQVTKVATNATSIALAKPAGVSQGDLMVAFICKDDSNSITPPAGWTTIKDGGSSGGQMRFVSYWKEAGASEPTDYTFTGDNEQWIGSIIRITGHEAGNPINVAGKAEFDDTGGGPDATPVCPDIPTWADDCIVLRAFGADDNDITVDSGFPAGLTGLYVDESNTGSGTCSGGVAHKKQATKGLTGTASFSLDAPEEWVAQTVAISKAGRVWPGNYFGSGADGAHTVTTAEQLAATLDGDPVIKHYSSLTINAGASLTTNNRCKGLVIYVTGDCTINGTLKMDGRGANFNATNNFDLSRWETAGAGGGQGVNPLLPDEVNQPQGGGGTDVFTRYEARNPGAAGGAAQTTSNSAGNPGSAGSANQTGGGGSGGKVTSGAADDGGAGSRAEAHGGGVGGGGSGTTGDGSGAGGSAALHGGAGGVGGTANASTARGGGGGGAGNNGGAGGAGGGGGANGVAGGNGSGGILFLVVGGNLTIGASGVISADGVAGGAGGNGSGFNGAGGGGSGGGRVIVLYKGTLSNSGTLRANGGAGGAAGSGAGNAAGAGGAGGAGTVTGPTQVA